MRQKFKTLAEKFKSVNEDDNKSFLDFYRENEVEVESLNDFESEEELYLVVVINHTYGRSLLYLNKDYLTSIKHLEISKNLILMNRNKFDLDLKEDVWYKQTLYHLTEAMMQMKKYNLALKNLIELIEIDEENNDELQKKRIEINRQRIFKFFLSLVYTGIVIGVISMIYRVIYDKKLVIDSLGTIIGIIGLVGAFLYNSKRK